MEYRRRSFSIWSSQFVFRQDSSHDSLILFVIYYEFNIKFSIIFRLRVL